MPLGRRVLPFLALGLLAGAALLAEEAAAERIILKNGFEIRECWILEESKAQIVVAIIRRGNIGRIILDPLEVSEIDRSREETLEAALVRARRALEEEERRRAAERAAAVTRTASPTPGAGKGEGGKSAGGAENGKIKPSKNTDLVGPATPEELEKIDAAIKGIGDTRNVGGAATRRENSVKELVQIGPKAIDALSAALEDDNSYRRMNAARALADLATQDRRLQLYEEAVPRLIKLLYDPQVWVRVASDKALQSISGQSMGFPDPRSEELTAEEIAAIEKWGKWWDQTKALLPAR